MVIQLEHELETRLAERAREAGKRPEELAEEMLRASLTSRLPTAAFATVDGKVKDAHGNPLGFDRMSWREIAHLGHEL